MCYRKKTYREMLKEPRPEDVRRDFRKDTPFLLIFLARRIVVFLSRTLAATDTRVTRVTCNRKKGAKVTTCRLGKYSKFIAKKFRIFFLFTFFCKIISILNKYRKYIF